MGDAVGDGAELALVEQPVIVEQTVLQDLTVQLAHAVDAEGHGHAQVGHVHLPVADDGHVANALPLIGIAFEQIGAQAAVQLLQDHVDAGKRLLHHIDGPALQRFGHDGMVGVGHAAVGDALRHLPGKALLIDQQADQLGNRQARMRVVDVENALVRQQIKVVAKVLFEILDCILQGGAGEEVVLLEAQHLALVVAYLRDRAPWRSPRPSAFPPWP